MDRDITGEALKYHTVILVETRHSPHGDQAALDEWEMPSLDAPPAMRTWLLSPHLSPQVPIALMQVRTFGDPRDHDGHPGLLLVSQNPSMARVGRDLCGSPSPTPCPSRVTQSRLHSTVSRRGWNISRKGDSTASLGSLGQCSVTLRGQNFITGSYHGLYSS